MFSKIFPKIHAEGYKFLVIAGIITIVFYIFMFIGTELVPGNIYNYIYSKLGFLKQSERVSE